MKIASIDITNEKISKIISNLISGSYNNDHMLKCLEGLLIDNEDARQRVIDAIMGITPDFTNGIKVGDKVLVGKSKYFFSGDYDIDKTIDAGFAIPKKPNDGYVEAYLICDVVNVRPHIKTITFDVIGKAVKLSDDSLVPIDITLNHDVPQLIQDGEDKPIHVL